LLRLEFPLSLGSLPLKPTAIVLNGWVYGPRRRKLDRQGLRRHVLLREVDKVGGTNAGGDDNH